MDEALQCSADILESIKWPVVVIVALLVLRKSLSELLLKTRKLKYKELEAEFDAATQHADSLPRVDADEAKRLQRVEIDMYELAAISPHAAILESWKTVESAAQRLIRHATGREVDASVATPYKLIQDTLLRLGLIEERQGKVFSDLRMLRNRVAHAGEYAVSISQAKLYVELAERLRSYLDAKLEPA